MFSPGMAGRAGLSELALSDHRDDTAKTANVDHAVIRIAACPVQRICVVPAIVVHDIVIAPEFHVDLEHEEVADGLEHF